MASKRPALFDSGEERPAGPYSGLRRVDADPLIAPSDQNAWIFGKDQRREPQCTSNAFPAQYFKYS